MVMALIHLMLGVDLCANRDLSRVRVYVVDFFGTPIAGAQVELKDAQNRMKKFLSKPSQQVPYGEYEITVSRDGYTMGSRKVSIESAETWITVGLSPQSSQLIRVEGNVRPSIVPELPAWVRLIPVYSDQILTQPLTESGEFTFVDILPGKYLFVVLQEERKVLGLSEVTLNKSIETVSISVAGKAKQ
jgi:hypothetical protein